MAVLYISYEKEDAALAKALKEALASRGHDTRLDAEAGSDDWRRVPNDDLMSADAVLVLLSEKALASHFVLAELGSARALAQTRGVCIVPVLLGNIEVPPVVSDLSEVRLRDHGSQQKIADAVKAIERELTRHFRRAPSKWPAIFISHRHKDKEVAAALVDLLEGAFHVDVGDIRCTSVDPYRMKAGERTPDRLRAEISRAKVVLGILTPDTKDSSYVMFELGASWGQQVQTMPLLAKGATTADVPTPIGDLNFTQLSDEGDSRKLMSDLADIMGLRRREGAELRITNRARELAQRARPEEDAGVERRTAGKRASKKGVRGPAPRARRAARNNGDAVVERLKEMLEDPRHPRGRYFKTLCDKTGLTVATCRRRLLELGARQVKLRNGEGWTLRPQLCRRRPRRDSEDVQSDEGGVDGG